MMGDPVKALTRSALAAAAGVVLLYLGSVLPSARLAILCASALGVVFIRVSCSARWALCCYAVTSAAALLLLPEKALAVLYTFFFGYYPIVKLWAERLRKPVLRWGVKLGVFNAALIVLNALFLAIGAGFPDFLDTGEKVVPALVWLAGNGVFLLYDYALKILILYFLRHISGRIK